MTIYGDKITYINPINKEEKELSFYTNKISEKKLNSI